MLTLLTSLFTSPKAIGTLLLAAIIAVLSGGVYYYKTSYETSIAAKATLQQQYGQALADLVTVNDKVRALAAESDARTKAADEALAKAQATTRIIRIKADTILQEVPTGKDSCESTKNLLKSYLTPEVTK